RKIIPKKKVRISKRFPKRTAAELLNYGIINLDKPKGPKSIHCVNKIREILEQPKAGHAGTLDPAVTGVLPVGLGKAVNVLPVLSLAGKVYEGKMHIHDEVTKKQLQEAFSKFTGVIKQTPPSKSAVARREREREVYWFDIKDIKGRTVWFEVGCQHGTYIRTLCVQVGEYLKVGAHMTYLRRIQAGPMKIDDSVTFEEIKKNYKCYLKTRQDKYIVNFVTTVEKAVQHLPAVWVDEGVKEYLKHGSPVFVPGVLAFTSDLQKGATTAVFDLNNMLLAIGFAELSAEDLKTAETGMAIKTDVVLI
ncbi:MAG: RNA-guided pseudouridylation complex pseudouridine synthase subunit Cbf5, partial [Candidatus Nanoarchaeia archaeon]